MVAVFYLSRLYTKNSEKKFEERSAACRKANAEYDHRKKVDKFIEIFGFDPNLFDRAGYKKEALLKLGFFAKELEKVGRDMAKYPDIYRSSYNQTYRDYEDAIKILGYFYPEFQQQIPHWTELHRFVDDWIRGYRPDTRRRKPVVVT
jgi:hypothetical protein